MMRLATSAPPSPSWTRPEPPGRQTRPPGSGQEMNAEGKGGEKRTIKKNTRLFDPTARAELRACANLESKPPRSRGGSQESRRSSRRQPSGLMSS